MQRASVIYVKGPGGTEARSTDKGRKKPGQNAPTSLRTKKKKLVRSHADTLKIKNVKNAEKELSGKGK